MHQFGYVAIVADSDGDLLTFFDPQQGSGGAAVVADGLDCLLWRKLEFDGAMRNERCVASPNWVAAEAEDLAVRSTTDAQPERIEAPDNADTPASWRNSRRFMNSPFSAL